MDKSEILAKLDAEAYNVTQNAATERPFSGKYDDFYEPGLYVEGLFGVSSELTLIISPYKET